MIHIFIRFSDDSYLDAYNIDDVIVDYGDDTITVHTHDEEGENILSLNFHTDGISSFRIGASV